MFIEKDLPLSSSSYRSGIESRFAMSLLTELEQSKGSVSYEYCAPSGAEGISGLPIQDEFSNSMHNLGAKLPKGRVRGRLICSRLQGMSTGLPTKFLGRR
jgi:hypothetical protein